MRSRSIHNSGARSDTCHPDAIAISASAPYQRRPSARGSRGCGKAVFGCTERGGKNGKNRPGEDFRSEVGRERRAPQPCPSKLTIPHVRKFADAQRLLERTIHEMDVQPELPDHLG